MKSLLSSIIQKPAFLLIFAYIATCLHQQAFAALDVTIGSSSLYAYTQNYPNGAVDRQDINAVPTNPATLVGNLPGLARAQTDYSFTNGTQAVIRIGAALELHSTSAFPSANIADEFAQIQFTIGAGHLYRYTVLGHFAGGSTDSDHFRYAFNGSINGVYGESEVDDPNSTDAPVSVSYNLDKHKDSNGPYGTGGLSTALIGPGNYIFTVQMQIQDVIHSGPANATASGYARLVFQEVTDTSPAEQEPTGSPVPEPASMAIWGLGALGCAIAGYRRREKTRVFN